MEILTLAFFGIIFLAIIMEVIDSSLGMMYGTVLVPLLIGLGYSVMDIVPGILLSQALGGVVASYKHHKFKNTSFSKKSEDLKVAFIIFSLGIIAVIIGVFIGTLISKHILSIYIASLMLVVGILVTLGIKMKFSWGKIYILGFIASFNKALSGGGFGPLVTSGQMIIGRNGKNSVGSTTISEVEICLAAFIAWLILNNYIPNIPLMIALCLGAVVGGFIGPYILSKIKNLFLLTKLVGLMAILSGILALLKLL